MVERQSPVLIVKKKKSLLKSPLSLSKGLRGLRKKKFHTLPRLLSCYPALKNEIIFFICVLASLYESVRRSVRRSVGQSVRRSVMHSSETCKSRSRRSGMIGNRLNTNMGAMGLSGDLQSFPSPKSSVPSPKKIRWTHLCSDWNLFKLVKPSVEEKSLLMSLRQN